jgi:hypothetical protein
VSSEPRGGTIVELSSGTGGPSKAKTLIDLDERRARSFPMRLRLEKTMAPAAARQARFRPREKRLGRAR